MSYDFERILSLSARLWKRSCRSALICFQSFSRSALEDAGSGCFAPLDVCTNTIQDGSATDILHSAPFTLSCHLFSTRGNADLLGERRFQRFKPHVRFLKGHNIILLSQHSPVESRSPAQTITFGQMIPMSEHGLQVRDARCGDRHVAV